MERREARTHTWSHIIKLLGKLILPAGSLQAVMQQRSLRIRNIEKTTVAWAFILPIPSR